jgi:predicted CXXCH cytochrome family protein
MGPVTARPDHGGVTCRVRPIRTSRLALLVALGVAAFLCGAAPAMADNGPHVAGQGVLADSCAGCHRIHTAKTAELTTAAEPALCYSCHDGTGAKTDVIDGVNGGGGALRGGGFKFALIDADNPSGQTTNDRNLDGTVPTLASGAAEPVTSTHSVDGSDAMAYGNGPIGPAPNPGTTIQLRCTSCHDPHGNGNYRILRSIPLQSGADSAPVAVPETANAAKVYSTSNYWQATDANEPNFILNVSKWCSTCHTRYLAPTESGSTDSGDEMFAFRHRSDSQSRGRPSCIQCHVAHGSNAMVSPPPSEPHPPGSLANNVAHPVETNGGAAMAGDGSRLLRITNQDTCTMCHGPK